MNGVLWHGPYDVRVSTDLPLPQILDPRDAIIQVTRSAICGTDLHAYRGEIADFQKHTLLGHEFTGVVEAVGSDRVPLRIGDRVLASDVIACGECWFCRRGWHYQCSHVSLFGYGTVVGEYVPGGQADFVRIPFADVVLSKIPDALTDEQALFVGDILTTGFACASESQIVPGDTVAVIGAGPVGLFAMLSAYLLGADRVLVIDPDPQRRNVARQLGGQDIAPDETLVERVHALTGGRGADVVLEAVGTDQALLSALAIVRARGTITAVGAHHSQKMPFPTGLAFGRELTLRFVVGDPIRSREQLFPLLENGQLDPTCIISHRLPLREAAHGYQLFDQHVATKVVLIPFTV
jgi:threonine dehydrogenase-like Zn-dependent dehydrogenase